MKKIFMFVVLFGILWEGILSAGNISRKISFDQSWRFRRGVTIGAESIDYDDATWRVLDLPHDWSIEPVEKSDTVETVGPFSRASVGGAAIGQTVGGEGWYRNRFVITPEEKGLRQILYFEGAYNQAEVWVNGISVARNVYGYSSFQCDITDVCRSVGETNVVAVRVINEGRNSRWYAGSGLYRHIWRIRTAAVHLDPWDTFIKTDAVVDGEACISVGTAVFNRTDTAKRLEVRVAVQNGKGKTVATGKSEVVVKAGDGKAGTCPLTVSRPALWSPDSPTMYKARITLVSDGKEWDEIIIPFGIRTLEFSADRGFLLNGIPTLLYGACIHHDNGLLGAAAYDRAEERKVELLKANGFNAVRCSHNPTSEHFLSACDSLGLLVIDEAFDSWSRKKNPEDYHLYFDRWSKSDMQTLVRRDRNHPSVIMWSIGNEIRERADDLGLRIAGDLRSYILELDTTRPVTAGVNKLWNKDRTEMLPLDKAFHHLDVSGYNYMWRFYEKDHCDFPQRVIYGSESVAQELAPNWAKVESLPYVIGDFIWTALDYLGESGIGNVVEITPQENVHQFMGWPWYNGWCGDIDLIGVKKPQSYFRDVVWRRIPVSMAVVPPVAEGKRTKVSFWGWPNEQLAWTYPGREGQEMTVNVYTRAEKVLLYLNGREIAEQKVSDALKASFRVPYEAGTLRAVTISGNKELDGKVVELKTGGEAVAVRLSPDRTKLRANGNDLAYVLAELVDKNGQVVMDSSRKITFSCDGAGSVIASGNGAPNDMESFRSSAPKFYNGRAMIIVKTTREKGTIDLRVDSEGLESAKVRLKSR